MSVLGSLFPVQSVGHLERGTENVPLWLLSPGPIYVTRADLFGPVLSSFVPSSGAPFSCQRRRLPGSGIYICSSTWLSNPPYQIARPPRTLHKTGLPPPSSLLQVQHAFLFQTLFISKAPRA